VLRYVHGDTVDDVINYALKKTRKRIILQEQ
jgi:hypothetical protein